MAWCGSRGRPIPGVDEAVARLRGAGVRVLFATNNSAPTRAELHRRLGQCGITTEDRDLLSSADVAAGMLAPGSSAVVVGDDGVVEALAGRGVIVVPEGPADAVVVGWTRSLFTFEAVSGAAAAVRAGARLVATNEDPTLPTPDGPVPGAGAILAAIATAAGARPEVAGKPHRPTADAITARVPPGELRAHGRGPPFHRRRPGRPVGRPLRPGALRGHRCGARTRPTRGPPPWPPTW